MMRIGPSGRRAATLRNYFAWNVTVVQVRGAGML
jgi:hypothetical protein